MSATAIFVASMVRPARSYRRMAAVMLAAALVPWAANVLHNLNVGWFAHVDLTPFAFTVTGGVLVWGLLHQRLIDLAPLARSAVLERMAYAVYVTDPFGSVVDVNPAGVRLVGTTRAALLGRRLEDVVAAALADAGATELSLAGPHREVEQRTFDVSHEQLSDGAGRPAGVLVVLHEITERARDRQRLERVLEEQSRVASALRASMIPPRFPTSVASSSRASTCLRATDARSAATSWTCSHWVSRRGRSCSAT